MVSPYLLPKSVQKCGSNKPTIPNGQWGLPKYDLCYTRYLQLADAYFRQVWEPAEQDDRMANWQANIAATVAVVLMFLTQQGWLRDHLRQLERGATRNQTGKTEYP